jgi:pimeloyl-ACP methyl ester carboxylesterase
MSAPASQVDLTTVGGLELEVRVQGSGPDLLLLHDIFALEHDADLIGALARTATVHAPVHPGFGAAPRPHWCDSVQDLVYLYLEYAETRRLDDVTVIGCGLGGWIGAELAVTRPAWLSRLVLVDSFGIRVGGVEDRDIADIFVVTWDQLRRLAIADEQLSARLLSVSARSDEEVAMLAQRQEGAALYGWQPYFHNPKLRRRLTRVSAPTLVVWGERDEIVGIDYGRALAAAIPGARFAVIAGASHHPQIERTEKFVNLVNEHTATTG